MVKINFDQKPQPQRRRVRWGTFGTPVDKRPWITCEYAAVEGEVLAINYGGGRHEWIPLHVIRGPIQCEPIPLDPEAGDPAADTTEAT